MAKLYIDGEYCCEAAEVKIEALPSCDCDCCPPPTSYTVQIEGVNVAEICPEAFAAMWPIQTIAPGREGR